jgi:hypothetical protein
MDMPNMNSDDDEMGDLDDDNDLEAELLALTGEAPKQRKPRNDSFLLARVTLIRTNVH